MLLTAILRDVADKVIIVAIQDLLLDKCFVFKYPNPIHHKEFMSFSGYGL